MLILQHCQNENVKILLNEDIREVKVNLVNCTEECGVK
jgi:hypothetical protein